MIVKLENGTVVSKYPTPYPAERQPKTVEKAEYRFDRASLPLVSNGRGCHLYLVTFLHEGASQPVTYRTPAATARDAWAATVRHTVISLRSIAYQCISIEAVTGTEVRDAFHS